MIPGERGPLAARLQAQANALKAVERATARRAAADAAWRRAMRAARFGADLSWAAIGEAAGVSRITVMEKCGIIPPSRKRKGTAATAEGQR